MKQFSTLLFLLFTSLSLGQTQNFWTRKADFPGLKRERGVGFAIGDKGYAGTGLDTAEIVRKDFWQYDPVLDSWAQLADLPGSARRNASAFVIGDNAYVGMGMTHAESYLGNSLNDLWEYNAPSNSWTQKASLPSSTRYFAAGFSVNGMGYIACGKFGPNYYTTQLWEYNPQTDAWTARAPFPGGVRYQVSSFTIDDIAYVGLGVDQDMFRNDFWAYNPASDQWTPIANLPASERGASHTFTLGQRGFVCMGNNGGILDDLWEYNPFTNDWSVRAPYGGSSRKNGIAFAINNKGYVGLGKGYSGKKMSMHEYTPYDILQINELNALSFTISPNPAQSMISISGETNSIEQIEILNLQGESILQADPFSAIDISHLPSGMYLIVAQNANGEQVGSEKLHKL